MSKKLDSKFIEEDTNKANASDMTTHTDDTAAHNIQAHIDSTSPHPNQVLPGGSSEYGMVFLSKSGGAVVDSMPGFESGFVPFDDTGSTGITAGVSSANITPIIVGNIGFSVALAGDYEITANFAINPNAGSGQSFMTIFTGAAAAETEADPARMPQAAIGGEVNQTATQAMVTLAAGDVVNIRFSSDGASSFNISAFKLTIKKIN